MTSRYRCCIPGLIGNFKKFKCVTKIPVAHYSQDLLESKKPEFKEILPVNKYVYRSHTCGELRSEDIGENVHLQGWLEFQRLGKFITLRDAYGATQLIIPDDKPSLIKVAEKLNYESVLSVTGKVIPRPENQENPKMKTGSIEIHVEHLEVVNEASAQLPFQVRNYNMAKEALQMQYRYLALRFPSMQRILRLRSNLIHQMREYLIKECGFVDVETPTLFRRTPGGAQEFVVPTQHPGQFYSLVQSPQQFKQLLMIGGVDRYFQIARCYRDERARADRQPEFTQLDIEMTFVDREGIISLIEGLLEYAWPKECGELSLPFKRRTYEDVMETYGSDQPDLRIPYRIFNVSQSFSHAMEPSRSTQAYVLAIPHGSDFLTTSVKTQMDHIKDQNFKDVKFMQTKVLEDSWQLKLEKMGFDVATLGQQVVINEKDALFVVHGDKDSARKLLGKIRTEFTNIMEAKDRKVRSKKYEFLWITDFPLFEKREDGSLMSTHHPFTAPHPEDTQHLANDPCKVRGLHYDLVLNGSEIAGGSIRIHNAELQTQILNMLNIDNTQMTHLLEALASGAPPHGGIAFGMDRLVSIISQSPSIQNVIAFPKTMEGRDLMSGAPAAISEQEKKLYHLK